MVAFSIKKFQRVKDGNHGIGYITVVNFDKSNIPIYKQKFNELKRLNIIIKGEFEDNKWVFLGRERRANFNFRYEFHNDLNLALKMFLLLKVYDECVDPRNMLLEFSGISFIIDKTECFNAKSLESFQDYIEEIRDNYLINSIINSGYKFLCFYDNVKLKPIIDIISKYKKTPGYGSRDLPNFKSIIFFDHILDDFVSNSSKHEKEKYYPVILWWYITKCIPIRPIELSELETNCIKFVNNAYLLSIPN